MHKSNSAPKSPQSLSQNKKQSITIEDSMEVISELQSSELYPDDSPPHAGTQTPTSQLPSQRTIQCSPMRISLATKSCNGASSTNSLPQLKKFFNAPLGTSQVTICPIRNNSQVSPLKTTSQVNELTSIGAKSYFKACKPQSCSVAAGDFHSLTSLTFPELCSNVKILNWLNPQEYYLVLCSCQSSDMVQIGFLLQVQSFLWQDDLKDMIKDTQEWRENPFQFCLYFGLISSNKKGEMAPVLMVEVQCNNINLGLDFFCSTFEMQLTPLLECPNITWAFLN